jgi:hypothetical protein
VAVRREIGRAFSKENAPVTAMLMLSAERVRVWVRIAVVRWSQNRREL